MFELLPARIVSLLPAATEIVCALGLRDHLVGRSHECDDPADVSGLPTLTRARIDPTASSHEIHEQVGRSLGGDHPRTGSTARAETSCLTGSGSSAALFDLDVEALAALRPDLVLTQGACDVCAISFADVQAAVLKSGTSPEIIALSPVTLADVFGDVLAVGRATGTLMKAREVVARLHARKASVACRVATLGRRPGHRRPRVAVIEWLDPPMAAGNWVPELVALAGGDDVLGKPGTHSHWISWADVAAADPDVVILAPCGFASDRIVREAATPAIHSALAPLRGCREGRIWAVDGHHLLNRPGPRLLDSLEVIAEVLHPAAFSFPATPRFARHLAGS